MSFTALALLLLVLADCARCVPRHRDGLAFRRSDSRTEIVPPIPRPAPPQVNRPDVLELEPAVAQAELILAVRLVDVTETKIVHGGRDVQVTEQYRFEPVRVLKGIFARKRCCSPVKTWAFIGSRAGPNACRAASSCSCCWGGKARTTSIAVMRRRSAQSIPRLEGKDDPLLPAVDALIAMTRLRDRVARVELLRDAVKKASGRAVSPLLLALSRRALLAARRRGHRGNPASSQEHDGLDPRGRRSHSWRHARRGSHGAGARTIRGGQGDRGRARDRRARRRRACRAHRRARRLRRECRARPGRHYLAQDRTHADDPGGNSCTPAGDCQPRTRGSERRGHPSVRDDAARLAC